MLFCRVAQSLTTPLAYGGTQHGGLRPGTVSVGGAVALADALQDANGDTRRVEERAAHLASLAALVRAALYDLSAAGLVRLVVRRGVNKENLLNFTRKQTVYLLGRQPGDGTLHGPRTGSRSCATSCQPLRSRCAGCRPILGPTDFRPIPLLRTTAWRRAAQ